MGHSHAGGPGEGRPARAGAPFLPRSGTLQTLQAGRGFAALAVVGHHATLAARDFGGQPLSWIRFGYLGVDFFFVLSGFIIYHSTVGRGRSAGAYARSRFRRVFLPYWPVAIGLALLYLVIPATAGRHHWSWLVTLTLLPIDQHSALTVAWTLQHELLFYAIFGILYFGRLLPLGLAVWSLAIVLVGGTSIPFKMINLEFLMGIACAAAYRRARPEVMFLAAVPFLAWIQLGYHRDQSWLVGLGIALILAPLARLDENGRLPVPNALILLGAASYSIYLVHPMLIFGTAQLVPPSKIVISSIEISLIGGFAYYWCVERHVMNWRFNSRSSKSAGTQTLRDRPDQAQFLSAVPVERTLVR